MTARLFTCEKQLKLEHYNKKEETYSYCAIKRSLQKRLTVGGLKA